jgi:hypothetical protein
MSDELNTAPNPAPEGQAEGQAVVAPEQGQADEAPFFEFGDGDEKQVFKTKEDLAREWKNSYLRRSDYDRKNQARESEYKKRMAELDARDKELQERAKEYERYSKLIKQRPDVYNDLKQKLSRPNPGAVYDRSKEYTDSVLEQHKKEVQELKEWKEQQELERQKQQVVSKLMKKHPDFNREEAESFLESLSRGGMEELYETLHFASKGRKSPTEDRVAQNTQKKRSATMIPPGSSSKEDKDKYTSFDEVANAIGG